MAASENLSPRQFDRHEHCDHEHDMCLWGVYGKQPNDWDAKVEVHRK